MTEEPILDIASADITRSTRDREELRSRLEAWLRLRRADAVVSGLDVPSNGMSSETILFDAEWDGPEAVDGGGGGRFVLRLEPQSDARPVFPSYDLDAQQRVMRLVSGHGAVPVPRILWFEPDRDVLGGTFFVMDRVDGRVPPDVLPYTMDGFVLGLTDAERRRLQDGTVDVLAGIHSTPTGAGTAFLEYPGEGDTALRRHVDHWRGYHDWVCADRPIPVLADAVEWLERNWPTSADQREPVLSWGDARIGNVIYDDELAPAAVLDWEMAAIAPLEVDVAWMSFLHTFFQDITEEYAMVGLPEMLRLDDVAARYEHVSGVRPTDLGWFEVYAAYRHGVIMARVHDRQVHFGDVEPVAEADEAVMHHRRLRRLIS